MFLARTLPGLPPQVYQLDGTLITQPRSWMFVHYRGRGACAIGYTQSEALQAAKRRLEMPRPALRVTVERNAR